MVLMTSKVWLLVLVYCQARSYGAITCVDMSRARRQNLWLTSPSVGCAFGAIVHRRMVRIPRLF